MALRALPLTCQSYYEVKHSQRHLFMSIEHPLKTLRNPFEQAILFPSLQFKTDRVLKYFLDYVTIRFMSRNFFERV